VLDELELQKISTIFSALGNSTRLKIVETVSQTERPLHIRALAQALEKDYAAIYRHVGVLAKSGVVGIYEVGRSRVIYLKNANVVKECIGIAKKML
jgi:DNA-binding transcriptional ArsR family regulator